MLVDPQPAADRHLGEAAARCPTACSIRRSCVFCCIGVYSLNNSAFDVCLMRGCSACSATCFVKLDCEPAPLLLGFVLGPLMEENLRRALLLSRRRSDGVRHAADQPHDPLRRRGAAVDRGAAGDSQEARGSVSGGVRRRRFRLRVDLGLVLLIEIAIPSECRPRRAKERGRGSRNLARDVWIPFPCGDLRRLRHLGPGMTAAKWMAQQAVGSRSSQLGISVLDQLQLPSPIPTLQLLFAGDGLVHVRVMLHIDQAGDIVLLRGIPGTASALCWTIRATRLLVTP